MSLQHVIEIAGHYLRISRDLYKTKKFKQSLSLLYFVVNKNRFKLNSDVYNINT
jgi:hypothetical protein